MNQSEKKEKKTREREREKRKIPYHTTPSLSFFLFFFSCFEVCPVLSMVPSKSPSKTRTRHTVLGCGKAPRQKGKGGKKRGQVE